MDIRSSVVVALILALSRPSFADLPRVPLDLERAIRAVPFDPPPKQLAADAHFVVSDEGAHWLFRDVVSNLGGAMIGVGTDPNYLIAGWARPELLILVDFDQVVVDVHAVYREVFLHCEDPQDFLKAWSSKRMAEVEGWLEAAHHDPLERQRVIKAFRMARNLIEWRLFRLRKAYKAQKVKTFLDDDGQYAYLRDLFRAGRVFALRGDLTGKVTVRGIGEALRRHSVAVRILYLSNAEKYFDFTSDYKANMRALPFDDRAVILRTAGGWDPDIAPDGLYTYIVQPASSFIAFMQDDVPSSFKRLVSLRRHDKRQKGLAWITALPKGAKGK